MRRATSRAAAAVCRDCGGVRGSAARRGARDGRARGDDGDPAARRRGCRGVCRISVPRDQGASGRPRFHDGGDGRCPCGHGRAARRARSRQARRNRPASRLDGRGAVGAQAAGDPVGRVERGQRAGGRADRRPSTPSMCRPGSNWPRTEGSSEAARVLCRAAGSMSVRIHGSGLRISATPMRAATTANTAGASCRRRWSRRSRSSSAPTSRRDRDESFRCELERSAARLRRQADAAVRSEALERVARRRAHLPEARGPRAHRRAQDQQRARAGAAGAPDGQAPDHRRDRGRAARRGDGDRLRAARARRATSTWAPTTWSASRSTSSGCGCSAPTVRKVDGRIADAQGRDQRSDARLGHQRRGQLLPARLGARPASLSAHGARVPVGHRARGARAVPRGGAASCRRDRRLRRRRQQRHGHLRRVRRGPRGPADRRRGRRPRHLSRGATRRGSPAAAPACCKARAATCCRTRTATSS